MRIGMTGISIALAAMLFTVCACGRSVISEGAGRTGDREGPLEGALSRSLMPPLELSLSGSSLPGNRAALDVEVRMSGTLAVPPVLRVQIPEDAILEEGLATEVLSAPGRATAYKRVFVIRGGGPFEVVVESFGPGFGAHASARWPVADRAMEVRGPSMRPIPSVRAGDLTVDEAVPLDL